MQQIGTHFVTRSGPATQNPAAQARRNVLKACFRQEESTVQLLGAINVQVDKRRPLFCTSASLCFVLC